MKSGTIMEKVDRDGHAGNESSLDGDKGKDEQELLISPSNEIKKEARFPSNADDDLSKKKSNEVKTKGPSKPPTFFSLSSFLRLCCAISLFLPLLAFLLQTPRNLTGEESVGQYHSMIYITSVASFSSLAPIAIEAIIDLVQDSSKLYETSFISNALMLITSLFPPIFIPVLQLFHASETLLPSLFLPLTMFQLQSWTACSLLHLHKLSPTQFTPSVISILYSLLLLALVSTAVHHVQHLVIAQIMAGFFLFAFILTFTYALVQTIYSKTMKRCFQWSQIMKSIQGFELLTTSLNCLSTLSLITLAFLSFPSPAAYCTALMVLFSLHVLISNLLSLRVFKTTVTQLQRDLNVKRTFVRYVGHEVRTPLNTIGMVITIFI